MAKRGRPSKRQANLPALQAPSFGVLERFVLRWKAYFFFRVIVVFLSLLGLLALNLLLSWNDFDTFTLLIGIELLALLAVLWFFQFTDFAPRRSEEQGE